MDVKLLFAIIATMIGLSAFMPYFVSVLRGKTKPHAYTWLIWAITQGVGVTAIWVGGGNYGALSLTIGLVFVIFVFLLALKKGTKDVTYHDKVVLIFALLAIVVWVLLDSPVTAVILVAAIDVFGYIPTFRKSYSDPYSEKALSWIMFSAANLFSILALAEYNFLTLGYIISLLTANLSLFVFLLVRRYLLTKRVELV